MAAQQLTTTQHSHGSGLMRPRWPRILKVKSPLSKTGGWLSRSARKSSMRTCTPASAPSERRSSFAEVRQEVEDEAAAQREDAPVGEFHARVLDLLALQRDVEAPAERLVAERQGGRRVLLHLLAPDRALRALDPVERAVLDGGLLVDAHGQLRGGRRAAEVEGDPAVHRAHEALSLPRSGVGVSSEPLPSRSARAVPLIAPPALTSASYSMSTPPAESANSPLGSMSAALGSSIARHSPSGSSAPSSATAMQKEPVGAAAPVKNRTASAWTSLVTSPKASPFSATSASPRSRTVHDGRDERALFGQLDRRVVLARASSWWRDSSTSLATTWSFARSMSCALGRVEVSYTDRAARELDGHGPRDHGGGRQGRCDRRRRHGRPRVIEGDLDRAVQREDVLAGAGSAVASACSDVKVCSSANDLLQRAGARPSFRPGA